MYEHHGNAQSRDSLYCVVCGLWFTSLDLCMDLLSECFTIIVEICTFVVITHTNTIPTAKCQVSSPFPSFRVPTPPLLYISLSNASKLSSQFIKSGGQLSHHQSTYKQIPNPQNSPTMQSQNHHHTTAADSDLPPLAKIKVRSSSPRFPPPTTTPSSNDTPTANAQRKIGIAVDLSDESAFAVKWAVHHYLRPGDAVILVHVGPTSVLYGADWGSVDLSIIDAENEESQKKLEIDFDAFTTTKAADLSQPLVEAQIPFKIHIVKDHDMKERLCLEVERLGLSAVIMGSRGFGATRRGSDGRLGSVSDYCVRHCVCPVVVVRYADEQEAGPVVSVASAADEDEEEEQEYHDASTEDRKG